MATVCGVGKRALCKMTNAGMLVLKFCGGARCPTRLSPALSNAKNKAIGPSLGVISSLKFRVRDFIV